LAVGVLGGVASAPNRPITVIWLDCSGTTGLNKLLLLADLLFAKYARSKGLVALSLLLFNNCKGLGDCDVSDDVTGEGGKLSDLEASGDLPC